jgi:hypothetical protein
VRRSGQSKANPKQVSFSPPSFKNEHVVRQSRPSFGQAHDFSINESGIVDASPERERQNSFENSVGGVAHMISIPVPSGQVNLSAKLGVV